MAADDRPSRAEQRAAERKAAEEAKAAEEKAKAEAEAAAAGDGGDGSDDADPDADPDPTPAEAVAAEEGEVEEGSIDPDVGKVAAVTENPEDEKLEPSALIADARRLTGVSRSVLAGALTGQDEPLTADDAKKKAEEFITRPAEFDDETTREAAEA